MIDLSKCPNCGAHIRERHPTTREYKCGSYWSEKTLHRSDSCQRIVALKAEVSVFDGSGCAEEMANGKGPCGVRKTCLGKKIEALTHALSQCRSDLKFVERTTAGGSNLQSSILLADAALEGTPRRTTDIEAVCVVGDAVRFRDQFVRIHNVHWGLDTEGYGEVRLHLGP